ncbi:MAG: hypothetical protein EXS19_04470 [Pedosphaera sp.]|nr:hypothetical protein [Pedosphaera sp.]
MSLARFARQLQILLILRTALRWAGWWLLSLGVIVLVARMLGRFDPILLWIGLAALAPLIITAGVKEWRRRPALASLRAAFDRHNHCGGLVMAAAQADTSAWRHAATANQVPPLRWDARRTLGLVMVAASFLAVTLLVPDRFAALAAARPLDIGKQVEELNAQIQGLEDEKILKEEKAVEWKQDLSKLGKESSGANPAKTWEALDHLKQSASDLARQAAEEAIAKTAQLTKAEALGQTAGLLPEKSEALAGKLMQELAALINAAKLDEGLFKGQIPPELLEAAKKGALDPALLKELLQQLQLNKRQLADALQHLNELKLIDPAKLGERKKAGQSPNPEGLAAFLAEQGADAEALAALVEMLGNGDVQRGPGAAPMTWQDPSNEDGVRFKEQALPVKPNLKDSQLAGVSRSTPEENKENTPAVTGALSGSSAGGGSAQAQLLLPRHKGAVQRYFKRETPLPSPTK